VRAIELVETHISWVLLTGEFAYKIKRPVQFTFVDMRALERRAYFCREELRLNRRFAPDFYLDVCDIAVVDGEARIDGHGEVIEYAVRMRQFERANELDRLLDAGRIEPPELGTFGRSLAGIHAGLPVATPTQPWGDPVQVRALILQNLAEAEQAAAVFGMAADIEALRLPLERQLQVADPWLRARRAQGRVRECHGDLHSRNIVRLPAGLIAFDCMEFEPAFRWVDVADELALLLVDLEARGYPAHAHAFLAAYLACSGDYQACRVLALYQAHRALVRAKVAALSVNGGGGSLPGILRAEHMRLIEGARRALSPRVPSVLLMCGLSGSGKTWLAERLAPRLGALHLRSDVERKRCAGLAAQARSGSALERGLYSPQASIDVYEHMVRCTEDILFAGYSVIVDATFARHADRIRFSSLAARLRVDLRLIHCHASRATLRARLARRQRAATDASEADEHVLDWQLQHFEPPGTDERLAIIPVDTDDPEAVDAVVAAVTNPTTEAARR
jgi:aminoglycoside phosphotransferase family enzyme/predicted kinase